MCATPGVAVVMFPPMPALSHYGCCYGIIYARIDSQYRFYYVSTYARVSSYGYTYSRFAFV